MPSGNDKNQTFDIGLGFSGPNTYIALLTQVKNSSSQYNANAYVINKTATTLTIRGQNDYTAYMCIGY